MANQILYNNAGPTKRYPGIPYEDRFREVRPIIFENVPSVGDLEEILKLTVDETMITPWSLDVVRGFRDYVPTTFRTVTEKMEEKQKFI